MTANWLSDRERMPQCWTAGSDAVHDKERVVRILFVPGFVADTYSEIERSFVELCAKPGSKIEFVWLVPTMVGKHNRFARAESRTGLRAPVWVAHLQQHGIQYVEANVAKYNPFSNWLLFRRIFETYAIDAVYTHFGFERFWAVFFAKLGGKVTIWNEHWNSLGRRYGWAKRLFYRFFVDEFISVSQYIASTLPRKGRVHTIPNAVQVATAEIGDGLARRKARVALGLPEAAIIVLMVAAFRPEKRHGLALEVCGQILAAQKDVTFVFLGEGDGRLVFMKKVRDCGFSAQILAPGHVDNVDDYYRVADVTMLTSHYEPFGYVVLEAMKYGLPVVAFASGGPAEVIRDGITGLLVADGDVNAFVKQLSRILRNQPMRAAMGNRAREAVQRDFNRELWIERLNKLLAIVVSHRRTPVS